MTMPLVDLTMSGFILFAVLTRAKVFEHIRESPVEGAFEGTFSCEVKATKSVKHTSKNSLKSSKILCYSCRAHTS